MWKCVQKLLQNVIQTENFFDEHKFNSCLQEELDDNTSKETKEEENKPKLEVVPLEAKHQKIFRQEVIPERYFFRISL